MFHFFAIRTRNKYAHTGILKNSIIIQCVHLVKLFEEMRMFKNNYLKNWPRDPEKFSREQKFTLEMFSDKHKKKIKLQDYQALLSAIEKEGVI